MKMADETKSRVETSQSETGKKPYAKPSVVSEPIYETMALACGKLNAQSATCNAVPRQS